MSVLLLLLVCSERNYIGISTRSLDSLSRSILSKLRMWKRSYEAGVS